MNEARAPTVLARLYGATPGRVVGGITYAGYVFFRGARRGARPGVLRAGADGVLGLPHRPDGELGMRGEVELAQNTADVRFDGALGDAQRGRDLAIRVPARDQDRHFALPRR